MTRALITGVSGQDGSYLAELLVSRGVDVHGTSRHAETRAANVTMHALPEISDAAAVDDLVKRVAPDHCYHLAADSFIGSDAAPSGAGANVASTIAILEALTRHRPNARFVLAGSAAQVAGAAESPQSEATSPSPTSPYGLAKQLASEAVAFFRSSRALHASVAILYNHESPRRGARFLSKKLAMAAARAARDPSTRVEVGDIRAVRDWGYAPEYVECMTRMIARDDPHDFVVASGVARTVEDMAAAAFAAVGRSAADHLVVAPSLVRAAESTRLIGDPAKAAALLGWRATTTMESVMALMVKHELEHS